MAKNNIRIDEKFCFSFKSKCLAFKIKARQYFDQHKADIENWWQPTSKVPIFIDTNFLLNAYSYPKSTRSLFINFLITNKDRIYITDLVDEEFQRKRPNFVRNYTNTVLNNFKELKSAMSVSDIGKHCESIIVKFENFRKRPFIQNDYSSYIQYIDNAINRIKEWKLATEAPCTALLNDLSSSLKSLLELLDSDQQSLNEDTDIINAVSQCRFCGNILLSEKSFIVDLYQKCLNERNEIALRSDNIDLSLYTFPGWSDHTKITEHKQPEGDFIHYHEMLRQMKELKKDVVFLTSDVKKGDNATEALEPYDHYICNTYSLTDHVYYIVDGKSLPLASMQIPIIDSDSDEDDEDNVIEPTNATVVAETNTMASQKRSYFRELTREAFLDELNTCINWADEYGDHYVSKDYFIYGILGHKRYEFFKSRCMLNELIEDNVLSIVNNAEGKECIVVKK